MKFRVGDKVRYVHVDDAFNAGYREDGDVGEIIVVDGDIDPSVPYKVKFQTPDETGNCWIWLTDVSLQSVSEVAPAPAPRIDASVIERLNEVVKTLQREKRRYGLKKSFWRKVIDDKRSDAWQRDNAKAKLDAASAEYDAIVARIGAVRKAIEELSK